MPTGYANRCEAEAIHYEKEPICFQENNFLLGRRRQK